MPPRCTHTRARFVDVLLRQRQQSHRVPPQFGLDERLDISHGLPGGCGQSNNAFAMLPAMACHEVCRLKAPHERQLRIGVPAPGPKQEASVVASTRMSG